MMYSDDDEYYYFGGHDYIYDSDDDSEPCYDDDDDEDDCYYNSYYDSDGEIRMIRRAAELLAQKEKDSKEALPVTYQCMSLVDICSKHLALNFPFAYLQDRYPPVPDDLQLRVISFSFPDSVEKIRKYAQFSRSDTDMTYPTRLCDNGKVTEMMQIGFRLSASVDGKYVTIHFDRGKITSAQCSCGSTSSWCTHVIATAIMRIKQAGKLDKSQMRLPVSDALNTLSREQLLKFSHYLLYHHQNHKIVETAQGLIDKLVNRHGDHKDEEINVVCGAPDPTAGPGLDEECHWLVCNEGFKDNCRSLTYESINNWGFASLEYHFEGNNLSALWFSNHCQQPLLKDEIDLDIRPGAYSSNSDRRDSSKILETVLEVLKDDSTSGLVAIKSCTEQVLVRLAKKNSSSPYVCTMRPTTAQSVPQPFYPSCSTAMGFTARPFRSWTLSDELARLWQVAVLNPKLKPKDREQIAQELLNWNKQAHTACSEAKLKPWKGLEVAYNLCQQINWRKPDMQSLLQGVLPPHYSISGCTLVEINLEETTLSCHLPYCFSYGSISLDIHSWCSIIHALDVYKYCTSAVNIAFCLSLALIGLYRYHADTRTHMSDVPIIGKCTLEHNKQKETADTDMDESTDMDVDENGDSEFSWLMIWPSDTLLSVRCFAFLYDILSSNQSLVESLIVSHQQRDSSRTTELGAILNNISDSKSLLFQLSVVGLLLPKFPLATIRQEEEHYDLENWLTFQLLNTKTPRQKDLELLKHFCKVAQNENPLWPLTPSSSFTRVILHHTYKELSVVTEDVFQLTLQNLNYTLSQDFQACPWTLFEFSNGLTWSKLVELCLSIFAGENSSRMERTLNSILSHKGILGQGALKLRISSEEGIKGRRLQGTLDSKSRIAFALAKALYSRANRPSSSRGQVHFLKGVITTDVEMVAKVDSPSSIMALKKCAIRLGAHSVFLEKSSDRSYSHGSAVRWLVESSVECGLWGIRCLITSHSDINDFLQHEEAINLCRLILKKKHDTNLSSVKEILLSLLRHAVNTDAGENVRDILQICRENNRSMSHILTPWACQQIRDMTRRMTVNFDSLMFASEELFLCYKERLNHTIIENQRASNLEGSLGLKRLFSDGAEEDEDSCKPSPPPNPYMTQSPHPFLVLSFELGIMGLKAVPKEDSPELRRCPRHAKVKEHLKQLCELVCYLATRQWLKAEQTPKKPNPTSREDSDSPFALDSNVLVDESYLKRFVTDLLKSDARPMMLMTVLFEMACNLGAVNINGINARAENRRDLKLKMLRNVVSLVPNVHLILESIRSKFASLLLSQKINDLITSVTERRPGLSPRDLRIDLEYKTLEEDTLIATLVAAKEAFDVSDPTGNRFRNLTEEMEKKHRELKPVLEGVLSGEDRRHNSDVEEVFRNPFYFLPLMAAQELGLLRRHHLDLDFLNL